MSCGTRLPSPQGGGGAGGLWTNRPTPSGGTDHRQDRNRKSRPWQSLRVNSFCRPRGAGRNMLPERRKLPLLSAFALWFTADWHGEKRATRLLLPEEGLMLGCSALSVCLVLLS